MKMTRNGREAIVMSSTRETFFNESQAIIHIVNANVTHNMWPRGEGKTSGGSGRRIINLSQVMPRSQCIIYTDTFKRSEEVLIPNILNFISDEMGLIEDYDFVKFKKPPSHWVKPLIQPLKFDRVVSFNTGFVLCCGAANEDGSVNGFNGQAAIIEETKYVNRKRIKSQLYKALRGGLKYFGHLPEYRSVWSFTDKFEGDIGWLLAIRDKQDNRVINAVLTLQLEVWKLQKELQLRETEGCSSATAYKYKHLIWQKEQKLTAIRKELVFVHDARPFANKEILGEKFYRDARRDCDTLYEYDTAILNKDPDKVQNSYYPALSKKRHFHQQMDDTDSNKPLIAALDYQWRIIPIVAGQLHTLPGRDDETLNIVNGVHTLHPDGGIIKSVNAFCDYYEDHNEKVIYYCYDHTAIAKRAEGPSYKEIATTAWRSRSWLVIEVYIGRAMLHDTRHEDIKNLMLKDKIMFNEERAKHPLGSIKMAGTKTVSGKTTKDKSGEKNLSNDPLKQTDYSEAFDMIVVGALIQKKISSYNNSFTGDISTR
jgi:hypothetical protein